MGLFDKVWKRGAKGGKASQSGDAMASFHSAEPVEDTIAKEYAEKDLRAELGRVQKDAAMLLAHMKTAERKLSECRDEIDTMEQMANKAVEENRESDAKDYLRKKLTLEESLPELEKAAEAARENYRSITENVENLKLELEEIKAM